MEIKDLAMTVELGTDMAEVRGGGRRKFNVGNIDISRLKSYNKSKITNGDVYANVDINAKRSSGASFGDVGSFVEYSPVNEVTQTSGIQFDITSMFDGLNFS